MKYFSFLFITSDSDFCRPSSTIEIAWPHQVVLRCKINNFIREFSDVVYTTDHDVHVNFRLYEHTKQKSGRIIIILSPLFVLCVCLQDY